MAALDPGPAFERVVGGGVIAYYNEIEPYAAQWLRNLIKAGLIPAGDVDERDIRDVTPGELVRYTQCHFFAGIGGWAYALRLAGWPDDRPVWTGSCPCQSFSTAGRGKGGADERHLWPHWFHLIRVCQPATIFGEQVASSIALSWLDLVMDDLEAEGYACGAADLCAAGVGAPHIRQRLWFVAYSKCSGTMRTIKSSIGEKKTHKKIDRKGTGINEIRNSCSNVWKKSKWTICLDGKLRNTEPAICPMVDGVSPDVDKLRAIGNAIVPQVAAEFIKATGELGMLAEVTVK